VTDSIVKVWSHHELLSWVDAKISAGTFKRCAHLNIVPMTMTTEFSETHFYVPQCARRSFEWKTECYGRKNDELHVLQSFLHTDPISCPKKCLNYHSKRWAAFRGMSSRWCTAFKRACTIPFRWFRELPAPQVGVVALFFLFAIGLLVPRWVPLLIQLVNAIRGLSGLRHR
jgi:hypothetical protein